MFNDFNIFLHDLLAFVLPRPQADDEVPFFRRDSCKFGDFFFAVVKNTDARDISFRDIFKAKQEFIKLLGKGGIDYSTPKTYTLKSIPREQFTGLQLLCMMYVGFQKIEPTMYTGLDFKEAYTLALDAYKARVH